MRLKTILHSLERHKPFVYGIPKWADTRAKTAIEIPIEPRANGRPEYPSGGARSECGRKASGYDRFHVMQKMNKAIDEVRAIEARQMKADGYEEILKHSRWCLLKRPVVLDILRREATSVIGE